MGTAHFEAMERSLGKIKETLNMAYYPAVFSRYL